MSKKVLIVTYGFPPSNQVAVHRILRLSKWLPRFGWNPIVLTVKTKYAHPYFYKFEDSDLCSLIPDELEVHRSSSFEYINHPFWGKVYARVMRTFTIPDPNITWVPDAVRRGKKLIKERHIDVVLTSLGPHSTALIGYFLKKHTSAKWIMDYRDPWCLNPFRQTGRIRYAVEKRIEDLMLSRSDSSTTTSKLITEMYRENYPKISDRFHTITNCYDPDLQFVCERKQDESPSNRKFRIIHAGSFYPKRRPTSFLEALVALVRRYPEMQNRIEVLFVGALSETYQKEILVIAEGLSIDCKMIGAVSYKESMQHICSSDLLLAINGTEERDNVFIPGKLFDYIAANKPILLIGHSGPASEIVEHGNLGAVRTHEDIDGLSGDIIRFYRRWESSLPFEPNKQYIHRYHASDVAKQLAVILDSVVLPLA